MQHVPGFIALPVVLTFMTQLHSQTLSQPNTDTFSNKQLLARISTANTSADRTS